MGTTKPAPTFGTIDNNTASHLYPSNFTRVPLYIYPWLNSTDLKTASDDPFYGVNHTWPAHATDGSAQTVHPAGGAPGGNPMLWDVMFTVSADITNTGSVAGDEISQLYVSLGGPAERNPVRVLRGFEKVTVLPGETVTVSFDIARRDLSNWSVDEQNWFINNSTKTVFVGSSSRILPLQAVLA